MWRPLPGAHINGTSIKHGVTEASVYETQTGSLFKVGHNRRMQTLQNRSRYSLRAVIIFESEVTSTCRTQGKKKKKKSDNCTNASTNQERKPGRTTTARHIM